MQIPKLMQREKEPKQPKYARISSTGKGGGGVSAVIKLSAPAALGRAPTDSAATPVSVKTELPTASEISDDDVKIVSAEARRKNGRLEEGGGVVNSVTGGVGGGRKEMQKLVRWWQSTAAAEGCFHYKALHSYRTSYKTWF